MLKVVYTIIFNSMLSLNKEIQKSRSYRELKLNLSLDCDAFEWKPILIPSLIFLIDSFVAIDLIEAFFA